jgi:hypothetical protein
MRERGPMKVVPKGGLSSWRVFAPNLTNFSKMVQFRVFSSKMPGLLPNGELCLFAMALFNLFIRFAQEARMS